jgi:hypothetical protein
MKHLERKEFCAAALVLALTAAALGGMAPAPAGADDLRDDGWTLAMEFGVKGRGGWTTCYAFAQALQERFSLAGGESHLVVYDWTDEAHFSDRHAFLVFRDAAGRYWGIDNRSPKPRWLRGTTPAEWAAFWDADKTVRVVSDMTDANLRGRTADMGRLTHGEMVAADGLTSENPN